KFRMFLFLKQDVVKGRKVMYK
ncbi:hypothetical protein CCACVL1_00874, partial [Corchorus capsularis]